MLACRLEERYAKNGKRRGLLYALRRRQSPNSFRSRWDCLCNEVVHTLQLASDVGMTLGRPAGRHVARLAAVIIACCTRDAAHEKCLVFFTSPFREFGCGSLTSYVSQQGSQEGVVLSGRCFRS